VPNDSDLRVRIIRILKRSSDRPLRMSDIRKRLQSNGTLVEIHDLNVSVRALREEGVVSVQDTPSTGKRGNHYFYTSAAVTEATEPPPRSPRNDDVAKRILAYFAKSPVAKVSGATRHLKTVGHAIGRHETQKVIDDLVRRYQLVALDSGYYCLPENQGPGAKHVGPQARSQSSKRSEPAPRKDADLPGAHVTKEVKSGKCQKCGKYTPHLTCLTDTYTAKYLCSACTPAAKDRIQRNEKTVWYHEILTGMGKK